MTLQKAMRIRSQLKQEATSLFDLLDSVDYEISFENEKEPTADAITKKQHENLAGLDGVNYVTAVKKLFNIADACLELNTAIESANKKGHELLFKETSLKSKLNIVDHLLSKGRQVKKLTKIEKTDFSHKNASGNFETKEVTYYNYPSITDDDFGMPLPALKKELCKQLSAVRDEIAEFNATTQVNYTLPDGLI